MANATGDILAERERQKSLAIGGDTDEFDSKQSRNDWVSYISCYLGRCSTAFRNQREKQDFRENMVKVAALALAAIEAHDQGYC